MALAAMPDEDGCSSFSSWNKLVKDGTSVMRIDTGKMANCKRLVESNGEMIRVYAE
jgi:hypothetical protein